MLSAAADDTSYPDPSARPQSGVISLFGPLAHRALRTGGHDDGGQSPVVTEANIGHLILCGYVTTDICRVPVTVTGKHTTEPGGECIGFHL